jgi:hypothetical protein
MNFTLDWEGNSTFNVHQLEHPKQVKAHFATPYLHVTNFPPATASVSSLWQQQYLHNPKHKLNQTQTLKTPILNETIVGQTLTSILAIFRTCSNCDP